MFELDKWYLDVITDDGAACFAYSARLRWGAARLSLASYCHRDAGGRVHEAHTLRPGGTLGNSERHLSWSCPRIALAGEWIADAAPIERTLVGDARGAIEWHCLMPRARAAVRVGDATLHGIGYVERLRITRPPSELPFHRLSWGRHLSNDHSLVWIDWHDGAAHRWIYLDGAPQAHARLTPHGIDGLDGDRSLRLGTPVDLIDRPAATSITRLAPRMAHRVVGPVATLREHKLVAPSQLLQRGRVLDHGWSLYEELT